MPAPCKNIIVMGARTGGVKVVQQIFEMMPALPAAVLLVQHMPSYICKAFCSSLAQRTPMPVRLAKAGDCLEAGSILVAPGDWHLELVNNSEVALRQGAKVNFVRPSIDVAMKSLVRPPQSSLLTGVLLTGMGNDGAAGISHIKGLGGITLAQEESSCPVFGMPKEAIRTGHVDYVLIPERIAEALCLISNASSSTQLELAKKGNLSIPGRAL